MTGASIRFPHLGIVIEHLDKSISIFGFNIAYYGIIIGIGMLCGIAMAVHEAKRTGQNPEMYYDFALCAIVSAIVGCRVYYVAFEWPYYSQHPLEILNLRQGGLAIYGGIIGGIHLYGYFFEDKENQSASDGGYGSTGTSDRTDHRQMGQLF